MRSQPIYEIGAENTEENGTENDKEDGVTVTPVTKRRRTLNDAFKTFVLDIKNVNWNILRHNKNLEDEHLLLFKSLLPHVRKITESRNVVFRNWSGIG